MSTYQPPVSALLQLGEDAARREPWPDYLAMGFTDEHVAELLRLAGDGELFESYREDDPRPDPWAPIHAWRTLGQLRSVQAIRPLMDQLRRDEGDWATEEAPMVFAMIGPAAIPGLRDALGTYSRDAEPAPAGAVANGLTQLAARYPEARDEAIGVIVDQLNGWARQEPELNGYLVAELLDANVVEAAPIMEAAFAAGAVDEGIVGDWEEAQIALGLLDHRVTPRPRFNVDPLDDATEPAWKPAISAEASAKAKAKRKAEKAARQRNRKKKRK